MDLQVSRGLLPSNGVDASETHRDSKELKALDRKKLIFFQVTNLTSLKIEKYQ
jgi:hypothetical protein